MAPPLVKKSNTSETKKTWDAVDKAASGSPPWIKKQVKQHAEKTASELLALWEYAEKVSSEVDAWPEWKRDGTAVARRE
jgi:hypothetical protein